MKAVMKKELRLFFHSPVAYVLIGLFFMVSSIIFSSGLMAGKINYQSSLISMGVMLIFITPVLTMRSFAEEHKNGTTGTLLSSELGITKIVLGKYFASMLLFVIMLVLSLAYLLVMIIFNGTPTLQILSGYIGFLLLAAAFMAIGTFMSSITENQIQASVFTMVALIITWVADQVAASLGGTVARVLSWVSFYSRYSLFAQGIFDFGGALYFITVTAMFLSFVVIALKRRRLNK